MGHGRGRSADHRAGTTGAPRGGPPLRPTVTATEHGPEIADHRFPRETQRPSDLGPWAAGVVSSEGEGGRLFVRLEPAPAATGCHGWDSA